MHPYAIYKNLPKPWQHAKNVHKFGTHKISQHHPKGSSKNGKLNKKMEKIPVK